MPSIATGTIATMATDGDSATIASLDPWGVRSFAGVPLGDELAFDPRSNALFITNRDMGGAGALTRIAADGTVSQRVLGLTAEGLAIDSNRERVYVANVNDGTVSMVDAKSMSSYVALRLWRASSRSLFQTTDRACSRSRTKALDRRFQPPAASLPSTWVRAFRISWLEARLSRSRSGSRSTEHITAST